MCKPQCNEPQNQCYVISEQCMHYDNIFIKFKYLKNLTVYFRFIYVAKIQY